MYPATDQDPALHSTPASQPDYAGDYGEEPATSIGEQDPEEQASLNEDYDDEEDAGRTDEIIDTNAEGTPHITPTHGLVEEGPGPDA